jgi:hypothetical protein
MKMTTIGLCLAFMVGISTAVEMPASHASTASIHGRVMDLFGTPLSDAVVEVTTKENSEKRSIRTNQDGSYLLRNMPVGEVRLVAKSRGFRPETDTLLLQADEQVTLDFGLEAGSIADQPPVELSGTVQQRSKAPIGDATVTVINAFNRRLIATVKTASDGRYKVEFKNGGQYVVYASKPGFLVSAAAVVLPSASPRKGKINLVLKPVSGSVYGISF